MSSSHLSGAAFVLDERYDNVVHDEIVKLRDLEHVTSIVVTHQIRDAFYVATHEAVIAKGHTQIVAADEAKAKQARFMVLHEGRIYFEGTADELRASRDEYLQSFCS